MAIDKEVGDVISAFEKLVDRIEHGRVYTEEEYKAISDLARMIDTEISLYRLEHCLPSSDTTH